MKKLSTSLCVLALTLLSTGLFAQTRTFKEVSSEIQTQLNVIKQDNQLVGYLAFTKLEKSSSDSFSYKITIMDENLNDIGVVNFKELSLDLQGVAFESDMICLAYTRKPVILTDPKTKAKEFEDAREKYKKDIGIFFQFITLNGVITKTDIIQEDFLYLSSTTLYSKKGEVLTNLRKGLQIQNIKDKGFAVYYGRGNNRDNKLVFYGIDGKRGWQKKLPNFENYVLQVATTGIHVLGQPNSRKDVYSLPTTEACNELLTYNITDGELLKPIKLRDPKQNTLNILAFRTNPETGRLNILGQVINPDTKYYPYTYKSYKKKPFIGIFSMDFQGMDKQEIKTKYSFFNVDDKGEIFDEKFRLASTDTKNYLVFNEAFLDSKGNAYFGANRIQQKTRVGTVVSSVVTLPIFVVPIFLGSLVGYTKFRQVEGQVLMQKSDGSTSLQSDLPSDYSTSYNFRIPYVPEKDFKYVKGLSGEDYFLFTDAKQLSVYNVAKQKVMRTISLKDGKESLKIFPAKQGYLMIQQYNSKEKSTQLSIEAL